MVTNFTLEHLLINDQHWKSDIDKAYYTVRTVYVKYTIRTVYKQL